MNKKKIVENGKIILFIENNKLNWTPPSNQTAHMRNTINDKIRDLGNKYYNVKNLFEKLKISRDSLFDVGKRLVEEYKYTKKGLKIQSQQRRMKESLIVWFTENFYYELFTPNSTFINRFFFNKKACHKKRENIQSYPKSNNNILKQGNNQIVRSIIDDQKQNKSFFTDILFNKEIDSFDYNIEKDFDNEKILNRENNFDFDVYSH